MSNNTACPCGSGRSFTRCCGQIITDDSAMSAEALMRSRYSAYVLGYWDYLHTSWHPDTRPSSVSPTSTHWLGLNIIKSSSNSVTFIAGFKEDGKIMLLQETSRFQQIDRHWRYVDGQCNISEAERNTPCPCGSRLKSKRCCGKP